ncbi:hypothetical protein [Aurantimonas marianensis]|uniref:Uncharacterized protein n=1 Tax=Aurantimonas marianensis TaxID=2920428 RepID=A0A9X2H9B0_9HYPH|nr:hypothetical protein [Aurantimonas marianensis]MCP3056686.1 hypothetical protein [Aurantimonas marianensis]
MEYELMREEDYDDLPEDDELKFAAIESLCRRRMAEITSQSHNNIYDSQIRLEYVATIVGAAKSIGLDDEIQFHESFSDFSENFDKFIMKVVAKTAEIRASKSRIHQKDTAKLANRTKSLIEIEISKLRDAISNSDLPKFKIKDLLDKLELLRSELHRGRFDIKKAMVILSHIGMFGVHSAVVASVYPQAITNILKLVGVDKEAENKEFARLNGGLQIKSLPSPQQSGGFHSAIEKMDDDEIPF